MGLEAVIDTDVEIDMTFLDECNLKRLGLNRKPIFRSFRPSTHKFKREVFSKMPSKDFREMSDNDFLKIYLTPKFVETEEERQRIGEYIDIGWFEYTYVPGYETEAVRLTPLGEYATTWFGLRQT